MTVSTGFSLFWPVLGEVLLAFAVQGMLCGFLLFLTVRFAVGTFGRAVSASEHLPLCVLISYFCGHFLFPTMWLPLMGGLVATAAFLRFFSYLFIDYP